MAALEQINYQSVAGLVAQSPTYAREILWVGDIAMDPERHNPFYDIMGGLNSVKPIKEIADTSKVKGQKIVITSEAEYGGLGISGDNTLQGNEEKRKYSQLELQIGWHRHAIAESKQARQSTVIGSPFDESVRKGLRRWAMRLKADAIEAEMHASASTRNTIYANARNSIDALGSNDVVTKSTIRSAKIMAGTLGTKAIAIAKKTAANQRITKYYFQGCDMLFDGMLSSGSWESLMAAAGERGDNNYLFAGHLPEIDGVLLNNWTIENTSADAAQGAFCLPRAYLGVAITADNTAPLIKGGGYNGTSELVTAAIAKSNDYFRYFPNAPFTVWERTIIPAGSDRKFLMIVNTSGTDIGKFGFYAYTTTNGKTIQTTKRLRASASGDAEATLTGSTIAWATGPWAGLVTDAHPVGSLIVPCNSKGQPYAYGYFMGDDAIICGYGSIDGTVSGAFGRRITQNQDYDKDKGVGVEIVWGVKAMENAARIVNGYILVCGAYNLPGMPEIDGG